MIPAEDTNLQHKQKSIPTSDCVDVVPQVFVYSVPISLQTDERRAQDLLLFMMSDSLIQSIKKKNLPVFPYMVRYVETAVRIYLCSLHSIIETFKSLSVSKINPEKVTAHFFIFSLSRGVITCWSLNCRRQCSNCSSLLSSAFPSFCSTCRIERYISKAAAATKC